MVNTRHTSLGDKSLHIILEAAKALALSPNGVQMAQGSGISLRSDGWIKVHNPLPLTVKVTLYRVSDNQQQSVVLVQPGETKEWQVPPEQYSVVTSIIKFDQVGNVEELGPGSFTVKGAFGPGVQEDASEEPPLKSLAEMLEELRNKEVKA